MRFFWFACCTLWLIITFKTAAADFEAYFKFLTFRNDNGTTKRNVKCDIGPDEEAHCDTTLLLCISWNNKSACEVNATTPIFHNVNSINSSMFEERNASLYTFRIAEPLPNQLDLRVYVVDHDGLRSQVVENFTARVSKFSLFVDRLHSFEMFPTPFLSRKQLTVAVQLKCAPQFYGNQCTMSCGNFLGDFYCDWNGTAICLSDGKVVSCANRSTVATTTFTSTVVGSHGKTTIQPIKLAINGQPLVLIPFWAFVVGGTGFLVTVVALALICAVLMVRRKRVGSSGDTAVNNSFRPKLLREWSRVSAVFTNTNTYVENETTASQLVAATTRIDEHEQEDVYDVAEDKESLYERVSDTVPVDCQAAALAVAGTGYQSFPPLPTFQPTNDSSPVTENGDFRLPNQRYQ